MTESVAGWRDSEIDKLNSPQPSLLSVILEMTGRKVYCFLHTSPPGSGEFPMEELAHAESHMFRKLVLGYLAAMRAKAAKTD